MDTNSPNQKLFHSEIIKNPGVSLWLEGIKRDSLVPPRNLEHITKTLTDAREKGCPIPFILTLCPAVVIPTDSQATRQLTPLTLELERLNSFVAEFFLFLITTKVLTGQDVEVFLVFADDLDPKSDRVLLNSKAPEDALNKSVKGIREALLTFDQRHQGLLQKEGIRTPKLWKQTDPIFNSNKRSLAVSQKVLQILQLENPIFQMWLENLKRTRQDPDFISTGWQSQDSAKRTWERFTSKFAECVADGEILPRIMQQVLGKRFSKGMPQPIFLSTSTRKNGILLEMDAFSCESNVGVIAPFHNIGRWTSPPAETPWNIKQVGAIL